MRIITFLMDGECPSERWIFVGHEGDLRTPQFYIMENLQELDLRVLALGGEFPPFAAPQRIKSNQPV